MTPLELVGLLFGTAIAAGGAGAILGLGGGILLIPVLTLFYGVDMHYAMGASIVSVIATSSGAAASYLRTSLSNVRIGLFLTLATVSGALIGAALAGVVPTRALELLLGLALAYSTITTLRQLHVELHDVAETDPLALRFGLEGSYYDIVLDREVKYRPTRVRLGFGAMFGAGLLSGLLGIGSGAFKVLAMDHFMRLPMKVS
ncbi:MAG TPA: sulfite exporter TauE/SafE family protein, partial [Methylomirabilota bacterium]|nr:sulfite exporter TauE/SafE family protein [Methylomirabilota bacterium]